MKKSKTKTEAKTKTETKIIVETITRYKAPCCSSVFKNQEAAERHLARCDRNKDNRTCNTCGHVYCGDCSDGVECRAEERKVNGKYLELDDCETPYARQCPYWIENESF